MAFGIIATFGIQAQDRSEQAADGGEYARTALPTTTTASEIGPTALAFDEWERDGVEAPDLDALRAYRLHRIHGELEKRDLAECCSGIR